MHPNHAPTIPHHVPASAWPNAAAAPQPARTPAATTRSRVRWGRIALALAGAVTIGVASWSIATSSAAQPTQQAADTGGVLAPLGDAKVASGRTVHGEGAAAPTVPGAPTVTVPAATSAPAGGPPMKGGGSTTPAVAAPVPSTAPPMKGGGASVDPTSAPMKGTAAPTVPAAPTTTAGGPPTKGGGAPEIANEEPTIGGGGPVEDATIAPADPAPGAGAPAVTGGGELPYTGAETWIALILGLLLLTIGIGVHVNAVRIGMTAMLYRRGILLRPVECARLANQHGLGRIRVGISNWLHRVLEENEKSDFVTAR